MAQQNYSVTYQLPNGTPLADGSVTVRLNTDAVALGTGGHQITAGKVVKVLLDDTGSATFLIWPNDQLTPAGTVYILEAFSARGESAWSGQVSIATV